MTSAPKTNQLLGYPEDARLLIINADDFGMCHANNEATIRGLTEGLLTSTTLMTPCPWSPHAIQFLQAHPEIAFGVHLTIIAEHLTYRWGPISSKDRVSSLLDESGYFFTNARSAELLAQAKIEEIEIEYRAQIATVLTAGLTPTHLDWHCLYDGGSPDFIEMTNELAREFGFAMRVHDQATAAKWEARGLPTTINGVLDSYSLPSEGKTATYLERLHALPAGLSEWAIHPGLGNAESLAMEPVGWEVRKADFDFVMSKAGRDAIDQEGIILLNYRPLQQVWKSATA